MRNVLIGNSGFNANIPADFTINLVLSAGVAKTLPRSRFPEWATHVFLMHSQRASGGGGTVNDGLFMKANGTASIPVADILDGTGMAVDVANCFVDIRQVESLSFICELASTVSICFYAKS